MKYENRIEFVMEIAQSKGHPLDKPAARRALVHLESVEGIYDKSHDPKDYILADSIRRTLFDRH